MSMIFVFRYFSSISSQMAVRQIIKQGSIPGEMVSRYEFQLDCPQEPPSINAAG